MKVQSYKSLNSYVEKSQEFLFKNEISNNLFWEIIRECRIRVGAPRWSGNVYHESRICLSALITPSNYVLLSDGCSKATVHLKKYFIRKKIVYEGISGPEEITEAFMALTLPNLVPNWVLKRKFLIYESFLSEHSSIDIKQNFSLKVVKKINWPRARHWATRFAKEANPELEIGAVISLAKQMMNQSNLFFLEEKEIGSCGMVGIRRETTNYKVINLVFVPNELRGRKYARTMVLMLQNFVANKYNKRCLLFSDYNKKDNLYKSIGFTSKNKYSEILIN